jgi:predicted nuclease with TOPRIM domain
VYLKEKVFAHLRHTIEELKASIRHDVEAITPDILRRVMENFTVRLQQCIAREGAHLDDLIIKK